MASRDIANMHLFLEMKKKFPELSEDTIRNYVFLNADDQEKCTQLLQEESKHNFQTSQPFAEFGILDHKAIIKKNENARSPDATMGCNIPVIPIMNMGSLPQYQNMQYYQPSQQTSNTSGRSASHAGVVCLPEKAKDYLNIPIKSVPRSAPVTATHERPFTDMYKHAPISSHSALCQCATCDQDNNNRMMFSTTQEHTILPPTLPTNNLAPYVPISTQNEQAKRHAVELSIIPSFPFQQQQFNEHNSSLRATASHSSTPGRHTTSLNFQLQPSSDQYPLEISTVPTNIGLSSNPCDFGSHVQISVDSKGTTFTALRLQRPHSAQKQQATTQLQSSGPTGFSSPPQNSRTFNFTSRHSPKSSQSGKGLLAGISEIQGEDGSSPCSNNQYQIPQNEFFHLPTKNMSRPENAQVHLGHGFQESQEYIQAVISHQKARLDLVLQEVNKEKVTCSQLKTEVHRMEQEVLQRRLTKSSFSYAEELLKLREENRKLSIECNCLQMEISTCSEVQIPIGVTEDDFYSKIFTGQDGAFAPEADERIPWACKKCTFENYPDLEKCEMCELPRNSGSFF